MVHPAIILVLCSIACSLAQLSPTHPSVFLTPYELAEAAKHATLDCQYHVVTGHNITNHTLTMQMPLVLELLHTHAHADHHSLDEEHINAYLLGKRKLTAIFEETRQTFNLFPELSRTSSIDFIVVPSHNMFYTLCVEIVCIQKRPQLFIQASTAFTSKLLAHHDNAFLQRHFGTIFMLPPRETLTAFNDKSVFPRYISEIGYGSYLPRAYQSASEVATYPVMVKVKTGSAGKGVYICSDRAEMDAAIESLGDQPYIIQVWNDEIDR